MTTFSTTPFFDVSTTNDSLIFSNDGSQILSKITTNAILRDTVQTTFSTISEWVQTYSICSSWETEIDYSIYENTSTKFDIIDIPDDPTQFELKVQPLFDPEENQKLILEIYNKLKQVFATLEKLILVELYIFVSLVTLFSQQFGGNRDLPVAFA